MFSVFLLTRFDLSTCPWKRHMHKNCQISLANEVSASVDMLQLYTKVTNYCKNVIISASFRQVKVQTIVNSTPKLDDFCVKLQHVNRCWNFICKGNLTVFVHVTFSRTSRQFKIKLMYTRFGDKRRRFWDRIRCWSTIERQLARVFKYTRAIQLYVKRFGDNQQHASVSTIKNLITPYRATLIYRSYACPDGCHSVCFVCFVCFVCWNVLCQVH